MGGPVYSASNYTTYSDSIAHKTRGQVFTGIEVHQTMSPENLGLREARDSDVHPNSFPVIIAFDVTGSMGEIPEHVIKHGLNHIAKNIIDAGIPSPAICFVAITDHISHWNQAPIQIGQFESGDQELIMWLERTWLEGGGGGGMTESYPLAWLFAGKHTVTDHWEKRGKKGVLITIGDEASHLKYDNVADIFGYPQSESYTDKELLEMAQEKWEVYHIHANDASYQAHQVQPYWSDMIGQNFIVVNNHKDIPKTIAKIVLGDINADATTQTEEESDKTTSKDNDIKMM